MKEIEITMSETQFRINFSHVHPCTFQSVVLIEALLLM